MFHVCTKHIEIDFHFIRDMVTRKIIQVQFVSTKDHLAEIFIKPLFSAIFSTIRVKLNVMSPSLGLWGHVKDNDEGVKHKNISQRVQDKSKSSNS